MGGDWSDEQNDAIVADYFAMLAKDIAGRSSITLLSSDGLFIR